MTNKDKEYLQHLINEKYLFWIFFEAYTELVDIFMCMRGNTPEFRRLGAHITALYGSRLVGFSREAQDEIIKDLWEAMMNKFLRFDSKAFEKVVDKWKEKIEDKNKELKGEDKQRKGEVMSLEELESYEPKNIEEQEYYDNFWD